MRAILASLDLENVGWKMVYNFLGIYEKTWRNIIVEKKLDIFSVQCIQTKTNVTTLLMI